MDGLNAIIGTANTGNERVIVRHGYGVLNYNGERLVELHTRDKSQADHLLINGKWQRSFEDVRVKRDSDVGIGD